MLILSGYASRPHLLIAKQMQLLCAQFLEYIGCAIFVFPPMEERFKEDLDGVVIGY
jgi:hypothetical protein